MFEIIQRDHINLRFDDNYFYEIEDDNVKVFTETTGYVELVTTIFSPLRIDQVDINTTLCAPLRLMLPQTICKHCGKQN